MLSRETDGGAGPGDEADGRGTLGREDEADEADGRRGGREGDAGPGDEADGRRGGREARRAWAPGRETKRTGAPGREADGRALGISTFSDVFRCLGRDLQTAATGISTLFG